MPTPTETPLPIDDAADAAPILVRFFAAAAAALDTDQTAVTASATATITDVLRRVSTAAPEAARVLARCSFIVNGVSTRDGATPLHPGDRLDVLPPFAGG